MKAIIKICFTIFVVLFLEFGCKDKTVEPDDIVEADWEYLGLEGEYLKALEIDPTNPDVIYLSALRTLYKTTNGGVTWDSIYPTGFNCMAIDPNNSQILYNGLVRIGKSLDGGITWNWESNFEGSTLDAMATISVVRIDPNNSTILYAGARSIYGGGILKSIDAGALWNIKDEHSVRTMEIAPSNSNNIYLSTSEEFSKSIDAGNSWIDLEGPSCYSIIVDAQDSDKIIVGCSGYDGSVLKSGDGGENWEDYSEGILENGNIERLVYNKRNTELYALAITNDDWGIYKRRMLDTKWLKIGINDSLNIGNINYDLKVDNAGKYLFFCSFCGVYRLKLS